MASEYTTNRRYPLYTDQDKPNLRDQYNGAIRMIDTDIDDALDAASGAQSTAANITAVLGSGFDQQHTVRMAIDDVNGKLGSGFTSQSTVADQLNTKASTTALSDEATSRQNADTSLSNKLGSGITEQNTVTAQLATKATVTSLSGEATARQSADAALSTRINNLLGSIGAFQGSNIMCVNDSWGAVSTEYGVSKPWMQIVCEVLRANFIDLHLGSTGFVNSAGTGGRSGNYLQRVTAWANNPNNNVNSINYIFVMGGLNDTGSDTGVIQQAMKSFIDYCFDTFPHAVIYFMPQIVGGNPSRISYSASGFNGWRKPIAAAYAARLNYPLSFRKVIFCDSCLYSLCGNSGYMYSDFIHPNQSGHNKIAMDFLASLAGGTVRAPLGGGGDNANIQSVKVNGVNYSINAQETSISIVNNVLRLGGHVIAAGGTPNTQNSPRIYIPYVLPICAEPYNLKYGTGILWEFSGSAKLSPLLVRSEFDNTHYIYSDPNWKPVFNLSLELVYHGTTDFSSNFGFEFNLELPLTYNA